MAGCAGPDDGSDPAPAGICGDGEIDDGEECDDGDANDDGGACTTVCTAAICGDGLVRDDVEDCDDGAANADDAACTSACATAVCGDGLVWDGVEGCDDGDANDDQGACTSLCAAATCGDGLVWDGVEDCDDGNLDPHDGCNPSCLRTTRVVLTDADAKLVGEEPGDNAGVSVAGAGDVDGDGYDDLLVGATYGGDDNTGAAYLVYGPVQGEYDLSSADATFTSEAPGDLAGQTLAGAGDVDGDGYSDILVGAYGHDAGGDYAGAAYLIYGPAQGTASLATADAKLIGEAAGDRAGYGLAGTGDVDGDGRSDLIIGAYFHSAIVPAGGAAYLLYGPVYGPVPLANADAKLLGESDGDFAGFTVASAGDVDGDGTDDILVGAQDHDQGGTDAGAAYLLYGPVQGTMSLADADAKLIGEKPNDGAGRTLAGAGDVDGDGNRDLLIGANGHDGAATNAGATYLVSGPASGDVDLAQADARLLGEAFLDQASFSLASAGDVDGDGLSDILIGSGNDAGATDAGAAYLLYGPVAGTFSLAFADAKLVGENAEDLAGYSTAGVGDVDGDGLDDILVGANGYPEGDQIGAAYLVLGGL